MMMMMSKYQNDNNECNTEIWLQVIPRRYARALLTAIYLDVVDPACIMRSSVSLGTLSEVQAAVASRSHVTATDEAMELYHIGRFIDFPALAHGMITSCSFLQHCTECRAV